jgi:hypothetical protein
MSASVAMQDAAGLSELLEKGATLHTSTSMDLLSAPAGTGAGAASAMTRL